MKIAVWVIGKTNGQPYESLLDEFLRRVQKYHKLEYQEIHVSTKKTGNLPEKVLQKESEKVLSKINNHSQLILLDEKGKAMSSTEFANFIEYSLIGSMDIVFLIGGAYGFHQDLRKKASRKISLSKMTFTHQMARVLLLEQIYRAFSIIHNDPYHNE